MSEMNFEEFEDTVYLAIRKVQTPEGSRYYDLPIGAPITADAIAKAKVKHSGSNGQDTSKGEEFAGVKSPKHHQNLQNKKNEKAEKLSPEENYGTANGVTLKESSLSGPNTFKVGESTFSAPAGSKLVRPKNKPNMAYVLTPDGSVHAFNTSGEVDVPEYLDSVLKEKFSNLGTDDPNYAVEEFDETQATALKDQKQGAVLTVNGEPAFTKINEDTWEHPVLGVTLTDDDLQPQFDAGKFDLQAAEVSVGIDFSKMSTEEIEVTLESYEIGTELGFNPTGENPSTLKKLNDGTWGHTGMTDGGLESGPVASMVSGTNWLSEKNDVPEDAPVSLQDPLSVEGSGKTKDQRLAEAAELEALSEDDIIDNDDIAGTIVFHKKKGMITKTEQNAWETSEGVLYTDEEMTVSAGLGSLSNLPWDGEQQDAYDEYQASLIPEVEESDDSDIEEVSIPSDAVPVTSLDGMIPGDEIYVDFDGMSTAKFILNDEGAWDSSDSGVPFGSEEFEQDIEDGNVWASAKSAPPSEIPEIDPGLTIAQGLSNQEVLDGYDFNSKVKSLDELSSLEPGTILWVDDNGGVQAYVKGNGNDVWMADGTPFKFTVDNFESEIGDGILNIATPKENVEETPSDSDLSDQEIDDLVTGLDPNFSTPSDEDDASSGLSDEDKQSAIEALEAHTGFQVKYGLKALPDTHPLKNDSILQTELEDAKDAYPNLPPKKALLAYLKGEKPAEPLADWEKELLEGDTIQIGSENPKKVIQGVTGGSFTQKEIQGAIDILENYSGKLFKNELQKKGNPVGALSPNDIIGFEKDKLVGKQKFIDFLKGKLEKNKAPEAPATPKTYNHGEVIKSYEDFLNLPIGTQVDDNVDTIYTKVDEDHWVSPDPNFDGDEIDWDNTEFQKAIQDEVLTFHSPEPESVSIEDLDPKTVTVEQMDALPVGSKAYFKSSQTGEISEYQKNSGGKWKSEFGGAFSSDIMASSLNDDEGWSFTKPEESAPEAESVEPKTYTEDDLKDMSESEFDKLPVGTTFKHSQGNSITKDLYGKWVITDPDGNQVNTWSNESFYETATKFGGWASSWDKTEPLQLQGRVSTIKELNDAPIGSKIILHTVEFEDSSFTKVSEDTWLLPESGGTSLSDEFEESIASGNVSWDNSEDSEEDSDLEGGHALIDDPDNAVKIGGQAGSNPGGLYNIATSDGEFKKFYVKKAQTEDHGKNEALANALYKELGVNAPNVDFASDGYIYSEVIEGKHDMEYQMKSKFGGQWLDTIKKDFAIDAWLSNRDVFGLTYDNILTDADGKPWKIDNGGALKYRAQGQKKTDFTADDVPELDVFKTGKKSVIFGENAMSKEQELDGVNRLAKLSPQRIDELVAQYGMDAEMADILKGRRKVILERYEIEDPFSDGSASDTFNPETLNNNYVFKNVEELKKLNSGQAFKLKYGTDPDAYETWVKNDDGTFDEPLTQQTDVPASAFSVSVSHGDLTYTDGSDKIVFEDLDIPEDNQLTLDKYLNDPVGTEYKSNDGNYKYKKTSVGGAGIVSDFNGESDVMSPGDFKTAIKNGFLYNVDATEYVNGISPGKYNTGKGAKAHLYVKPDGTGVYVGMKGITKELDAEGVKKNYDAGMNVFSQFVNPGDYPDGSGEGTAATKKKSTIIPTLGDVKTLQDGTYNGPLGVTYTVNGDEVTASKAIKTMEFTSVKLGQVPDKHFKDNAPTGTKMRFELYGSTYYVTKNEDGEWVGDETAVKYLGDVDSPYAWKHKNWKVDAFPGSDDKNVTKASLKSKYLQGQLLNPETNSSVFPPGYSGGVTFFGGPTDISSLSAYRDYMKDPDISLGDKAYAHNTMGVPMNINLINTYVLKKHNLEVWETNEQKIDFIVEELDEFLATAKVPEAKDFSQVFQKDEFGAVAKPVEAAGASKPSWYDSTSAWTEHIKVLSGSIGDGDLIGQNMAGATKDDKDSWVSYFNNGDFGAMYNIELQVAKKKGKTHPTGTAHPGHPDNKDTHKIIWGSAVPGEVPAGKEIPGEWSTYGVEASLAEIDNYLILAKMQNPTHLSNADKRLWVREHRKGNKNYVDSLSATAALRAKNNEEPKSEPPVWTDNVVPAKSYDSMFDDTQFPQNWLGYPNYDKALDFYNDHKDQEPELQSLFEKYQTENPYNADVAHASMAVQDFFAKKEEEYLEELNKPIWEVKKTISEGSHPTFIVKDQKSEKMKIFKPTTTGKEWRADNEVAAHNLGAMLGFSVPGAVIGEVNEGIPMGSNNKGIVMDFAPNVGSLGNVDGSPMDLKTLTPEQFGQLAKEHVFDWFLDNDDTHDENMLVGTNGNLVAIDKGRAFVQYGHWHGLDVDNPDSLNINTQDSPSGKSVVYADMINAIKNGSISQEQLDEAYKQALKAAKRVQKSDDNTISAYVRSASDQRTNWDIPAYAKDWKFLSPHPTNQDELVESVLARKNSMVEDFEEFYEKLYKAAGYAKPVPPEKALGEEHLSGWEEADVLTKTEEAKVWGAAPIHGSAGFADGASLLWTEKDTNGNSVISGKIKLGNITQQKVMDFMATKASPHSGVASTATLKDYPTGHVKTWKKTVTAVGKDLSNNATTGDYNDDLWNEMKQVEDKVNVDLAYAETVDISDGGTATFPSGLTIPTETVPMYVMALNYHKGLISNVEKAKAAKEATNKEHFQDFSPPQWKTKGTKYISPEGWTYKELDDGNYVEVKNGVASVVPDAPDAAKSGAPGWTVEKPDGAVDESAEKYSVISAGMFAGQLNENGEKILKSDFNTSGHPGKEYRIDLPTGEKIFFRDGNTTGTVLSQTGTVRFQLNRLIDSESSLSNIQSYLETIGVDTSGADEEQVESVYWRQMFGRIIASNPSGASASVKKVRDKLIGMKGELSMKTGKTVNDFDIPEAVGLTEKDERTFWHNLAVEAWGEQTVNDFLANGDHLPRYQHMDLNDPEKATGLPWYKRIDVQLDALYAKGTMLAHGNGGKDKRHFDYIKSGAYTSTEERLRILGFYKTGASSSSDQGTGGANSVFTRVAKGQALKNGAIYGSHVMYWSPEVMSMTGTYSYDHDDFGRINNQQNGNKINPLDSLDYSGGGNETMIPNNVAILDFMEIMVFDDENERLKAIEEFKKKGIETLRGLPIEDRMVNRKKLDDALAKIKKAWKQ